MSSHRPAGVVLTGGASARMGSDKALLLVKDCPMAVRVADALWEAGCHPVWCQGGDLDALTELGLDVVPDSSPGEGPLVAIRSALAHADGADIVVAACDLVDLDRETVGRVVAAAGGGRHGAVADVVVAHADDRDHLLAWWSARATDRLARLVDDGVRSLRDAFTTLEVVRVEVPVGSVRNVNEPDDAESRDGPA